MKGKLRYIGILAGALLVILIAIPFFINVNSFGPAIEQRLSSTLGRGVQIGNLSLSIFSAPFQPSIFQSLTTPVSTSPRF